MKIKYLPLIVAMMFFDANLYCYFSPGTQWDMNSESLPAVLGNGNEGGGSWNPSIGSGGGVDYSTWIRPIAVGGITTAGVNNSVLLATSAAADWKGNGVFFTGGTNLNLSGQHWQITQVDPGVSFTVAAATASVVTVASGAVSGGSMNLGGSLSGNGTNFPIQVNKTENAIFESLSASSTLWIKNGFYQWASITALQSIFSMSTPTYVIGYNNVRGDNPTPFGASTSAPSINMGSNSITPGSFMRFKNLKIFGTGTQVIASSDFNYLENVKIENNSSTRYRFGVLTTNTMGNVFKNSEFVSQHGFGIVLPITYSLLIDGCYIHSSSTGMGQGSSSSAPSPVIINSVVASNRNVGLTTAHTGYGNNTRIINSAFIGFDNIKVSTMIFAISTNTINVHNSIFYNGYSAIHHNGVPNGNSFNNKNSYFGFVSTFSGRNAEFKHYFDTMTAWGFDPGFVNSTEIFGTTATISGTTILMHQGGFFDANPVTDNVDYVQVHWGSGAEVGSYKIIGHSSFSITTNGTIGTNSTADKVFTIRTGKNFSIGTNLKALAQFAVGGSSATSYTDIGPAQRQEQSAGATTAIGIIGN